MDRLWGPGEDGSLILQLGFTVLSITNRISRGPERLASPVHSLRFASMLINVSLPCFRKLPVRWTTLM